jgi:PAS domain S-box-containing protein
MLALPNRVNPQSAIFRYLIAILSVALALIVRQVMNPVIGDRLPFSTFFVAIIVTSWWAGVKPTLLALLLSSLAAIFLFVQPTQTQAFVGISDLVAWIVFLAVGLYIALNSKGYNFHSRGFHQDMTEHKAIEAAQARLSAIVESSDDAIVSKTLDGTVVSWNAGAERIFGYTQDEVVGKSIRLLFPPERLQEEDEFQSVCPEASISAATKPFAFAKMGSGSTSRSRFHPFEMPTAQSSASRKSPMTLPNGNGRISEAASF